jgi:hypothetical protein
MFRHEPEFQVGDLVYHSRTGIGEISDVYFKDGEYSYRVNYCQFLKMTPQGGNGGVWRKGYPRPVEGDAADELYVQAFYLNRECERMEKRLRAMKIDLDAMKRAREILLKERSELRDSRTTDKG